MLPLFYSELYTGAISDDARFPKHRYRLVRERLEQRGLQADVDIGEARAATREELLLVHDEDFVDAFVSGQMDRHEIRRIGFRPWKDSFVDRAMTITGGSIQALHAALTESRIAGNIAGGTHHAFRDHGEGYCVFNDIAICAEIALRDYDIERVFVVDVDVHQGNGTAAIFADDARVFTYSLHCEKNYPFRKQESDADVGVGEGAGDDAYLEALETTLPRLLYDFRPDLLLFQAGTDPLAEDGLGRLKLTRDGLKARNELVFDYADYWELPVVVFMGGGYSEPIELSVEAHVDVYEEAARRIRPSGSSG
jgi:acetoin utilization deacetylase AcuC-like enzyme